MRFSIGGFTIKMFLVVKGSPVEGLEFYGPFQTEDDALSWAMVEWEDQADWWPAELTHPDKSFNDTPVVCDNCGTSMTCDECRANYPVVTVSGEELEAMLGRAKHSLPKEVMLDLSGIAEVV